MNTLLVPKMKSTVATVAMLLKPPAIAARLTRKEHALFIWGYSTSSGISYRMSLFDSMGTYVTASDRLLLIFIRRWCWLLARQYVKMHVVLLDSV